MKQLRVLNLELQLCVRSRGDSGFPVGVMCIAQYVASFRKSRFGGPEHSSAQVLGFRSPTALRHRLHTCTRYAGYLTSNTRL